MLTQYQPARLKRAGRRCTVVVCHEQLSVWLRLTPYWSGHVIYQLITAETHAVGRHRPVSSGSELLIELSRFGEAVTDG